jgi:two-component system chemotaxis response regulator CheY
LKILLVEDDPVTRSALARLLRRAGAEVTTALDGTEGLDHLLRDRIDVLLTDLHMPGASMNGFDLIGQAHLLPLERRPKRVVAMSGEYDRQALAEVGQTQGSVDFFLKPIDLNQLLDTLGGRAN